jgi:purine-binding chemotaxis protein CheW
MTDNGRGSADDGTLQVVCFRVGDGTYALDIMRIKEIIRPVPITKVPLAPPFVEGIIELRGAFLPLVDLRKRFDLPAGPADRDSKYIIVGIDGRIVGLLVDAVADRRRVPTAEISDPPAIAVGGRSRFFAGVVKSEGDVLVLLDLDAILSASEKDQLRGMETAPV